jgi:hypothetical protein
VIKVPNKGLTAKKVPKEQQQGPELQRIGCCGNNEALTTTPPKPVVAVGLDPPIFAGGLSVTYIRM